MSTAVVDSPHSDQARTWWFLDTLVVEHRGAPDMTSVVLEMTLPAGSTPPLHVHHNLDDAWYILEGEMALQCGDDRLVVGAGHWVSMPRGVPHTFRVLGDSPARILMVHDNPSFRDLIRAVGVATESRVVPSEPVIPPMDELVAVASAHDLIAVGPPMSPDQADAILTAAL